MTERSLQTTLPAAEMTALDRQVLEHSGQWLLTGIYLRCTTCGAGQTASEGNQLFVHESSCPHAAGRRHPWHELSCILHGVPSLNLAQD